jgi:predicted Zn finger-like uncharacterized protein
MLIVCPNCATSYEVEPPALGPEGRSVRCARCKQVWFAAVPRPVLALVGADDFDLIDSEPGIPATDAPSPPPEEPGAERDNFRAEMPPEQPQAVDEEEPASADEPVPEENPNPAPASIDGIDLGGLSADIEAERAQQTAEADGVLAEVVSETTVDEAPPLVPAIDPPQQDRQPPLAEDKDDPEAIEAFAAERERRQALRKSRRWPIQGLTAALIALVALNAGLVIWRNDIVRLAPQTASIYAATGMPVNLRGLAFENIRTSKEMQDGVAVLVVEGSIVNVTGKAVEVPRLRLAIRNDSKNEIYTWTTLPPRSILGPAEELPFRSRLASPPAESRDVALRFFNRRDLAAGLR